MHWAHTHNPLFVSSRLVLPCLSLAVLALGVPFLETLLQDYRTLSLNLAARALHLSLAIKTQKQSLRWSLFQNKQDPVFTRGEKAPQPTQKSKIQKPVSLISR